MRGGSTELELKELGKSLRIRNLLSFGSRLAEKVVGTEKLLGGKAKGGRANLASLFRQTKMSARISQIQYPLPTR
jgi:hypothetical protein